MKMPHGIFILRTTRFSTPRRYVGAALLWRGNSRPIACLVSLDNGDFLVSLGIGLKAKQFAFNAPTPFPNFRIPHPDISGWLSAEICKVHNFYLYLNHMDIDIVKKETEERIREIDKELGRHEIISDMRKMGILGKESTRLKELLSKIEKYKRLENDIIGAKGLVDSGDEEIKKMANEELANLENEKKSLEREITISSIPPDPNDEKSAIIEIRAGTGGDEAELFASDLFRMYSRYAERKGYKTEVENTSRSTLGGIKEIIFEIKGRVAYGNLKFEGGVHRVQRIPSTEKSGRIHTSAATVAVFPEAEARDIEIKSDDLKIDTYRSSGHGGQSVNTTDSAVRITHLPTGTVVACQDERSQLKNKEKAMKILRSRVLAKQQEDEAKAKGEVRKLMVGSGDRSEKIRTYNFPQDRVTDHRIHLTLHNIVKIMDGDLEKLISALKNEAEKEKANENQASSNLGS
jgi:peptide chain release factor 1